MDIRSTLTELGVSVLSTRTNDLDRIMGFFSDDCVLDMPRGKASPGVLSLFRAVKSNVRDALATRFEGLPDVHYRQ